MTVDITSRDTRRGGGPQPGKNRIRQALAKHEIASCDRVSAVLQDIPHTTSEGSVRYIDEVPQLVRLDDTCSVRCLS